MALGARAEERCALPGECATTNCVRLFSKSQARPATAVIVAITDCVRLASYRTLDSGAWCGGFKQRLGRRGNIVLSNELAFAALVLERRAYDPVVILNIIMPKRPAADGNIKDSTRRIRDGPPDQCGLRALCDVHAAMAAWRGSYLPLTRLTAGVDQRRGAPLTTMP